MKNIKTMFRKTVNAVNSAAVNLYCKAQELKNRFFGFNRRALYGNAGEGYIDTAVKILIAVVLGALLLAGLYALFNDTVMPTLKDRIEGMFDYAG